MTYLGYSEGELLRLDGYWTAREIDQQPGSWVRAQQALLARAGEIAEFLDPLLARTDLRIILTGAGTSSFVGTSLAPGLSEVLHTRVEAIPTTDLVSAPTGYLRKDIATLLVSFARSGDSPESVAAVELADKLVDKCWQLVVSCNPEGELLRWCAKRRNVFTLLLPEETNDRGFAMTSSFSTMLLVTLAAFRGVEQFAPTVARLSQTARSLIDGRNEDIASIARPPVSRALFLGSHILQGLAREAALKMLELTDGKVQAAFDSPLGVRHGPKAGLTEESLVVVFISNDPYTRKYDLDILNELAEEKCVRQIVAVTARPEDVPAGAEHFVVDSAAEWSDLELLFPYTVFAQILAFHRALQTGCQPDNPNVTGTVNRVVQGVKIHPWAG